ncbi:MAG: hypothetical protein H6633_35595 [Anaerolineales bacterium]|nr:hypothetical protein [Anaerolineales bacterium]
MQPKLTHPAGRPTAASTGSPAVQPAVRPLLSTPASVILLVAVSMFAIAPLFYPGFIQTHSGFVSVWNVIDLRANFGHLTWTPHLATTFDPFRSDGLLPYYLAALLPLTPIAAIKFILGFGWLMGGLGVFLWLKSWLGGSGALVAGVVYTYLPYQIVNVYVRGAWGETLFWGLLPWAILAATYLVTTPRLILLPIAAAFWLALGLSQLGLTVFGLIFMAAMLLTIHRPQALLPLLAAVLGTSGAALIYWLLLPHTIFQPAPTPFTNHFLYPFQLFSARWGFGASQPGWNDGLSLQIGLVAIGLTIVTTTIWLREYTPVTTRTDRRLIFFLVAAIALSLLQFSITTFLWNFLAGLLTYPWQLLGFIGLCLSIVGGAALWLDTRLTQPPLLATIIIIVVLSVYPYLLPNFIQPETAWLDGPQATLGDNQLALLDHRFSVTIPGHTAGLSLGETTIPLQRHGPLQPNETLTLAVTWQPMLPLADNLKVFVHLVDPNGNVVAQFDGYPQNGSYPTPQWMPGEIIQDAYPILLPDNLPPGPYRVYLGLYDETTFARLPVPDDNEGRIILDVQ